MKKVTNIESLSIKQLDELIDEFTNPSNNGTGKKQFEIFMLYYHRASKYRALGDYDKSIVDYTESLRLNSNNVNGYVGRAKAHHAKGDINLAIADFTTSIAKSEHSRRSTFFDGRFFRGHLRKIIGEYDKAIEDFTLCLQKMPNSVQTLIFRGKCQKKKSKYRKAVQDFSRALQFGENVEALCLRGESLEKVGGRTNIGRAKLDFERVLKHDPQNFQALSGRARCLEQTDVDQAIKEYSILIDEYFGSGKIAPQYQTYNSRGQCFFRKGQYESAVKDFESTIQLHPKSCSVHYNRGLCYFATKEYDIALRDFEKAIKLKPDYPKALFFKAKIHILREQYPLAVEYYASAITLDPSLFSSFQRNRRTSTLTPKKRSTSLLRRKLSSTSSSSSSRTTPPHNNNNRQNRRKRPSSSRLSMSPDRFNIDFSGENNSTKKEGWKEEVKDRILSGISHVRKSRMRVGREYKMKLGSDFKFETFMEQRMKMYYRTMKELKKRKRSEMIERFYHSMLFRRKDQNIRYHIFRKKFDHLAIERTRDFQRNIMSYIDISRYVLTFRPHIENSFLVRRKRRDVEHLEFFKRRSESRIYYCRYLNRQYNPFVKMVSNMKIINKILQDTLDLTEIYANQRRLDFEKDNQLNPKELLLSAIRDGKWKLIIKYVTNGQITDLNHRFKDYDGDTLLHIATKKSRPLLLSTLLYFNSDIYVKNNEGKRPSQTIENSSHPLSDKLELVFQQYENLKKKNLAYEGPLDPLTGLFWAGRDRSRNGLTWTGRLFKLRKKSLLTRLSGQSKLEIRKNRVYYPPLKERGAQLVYEGSFLGGLRHGIGRSFFERTGKRKYHGRFKDGKRHGNGQSFNERGKLVYRGYWKQGQYIGQKPFFSDELSPSPTTPSSSSSSSNRDTLINIINDYSDNDDEYLLFSENNERNSLELNLPRPLMKIDLTMYIRRVNYTEDYLGGGSYGEVFRINYGGEEVTAKVLHKDSSNETLLRNEVMILKDLDHKNIIKLIGWSPFEFESVGFMMELCDGGSVSDLIGKSEGKNGERYGYDDDDEEIIKTEEKNKQEKKKKEEEEEEENEGEEEEEEEEENKKIEIKKKEEKIKKKRVLVNKDRKLNIPWKTKIKILEGLVDGMVYLHHRKNIVHFDLKWSNILLKKDEDDNTIKVKIIDFGLARKLTEEDRRVKLNKPRGTGYYVAPEVALGQKAGTKADIFSFGIMMFELLCETSNPFNVDYEEINNIRFVEKNIVTQRDYRPKLEDFGLSNVPSEYCEWISTMRSCWLHNPSWRPDFLSIKRAISGVRSQCKVM